MGIKKILKSILGVIRPVNKMVALITYAAPNNRLKGMNIIITGGGRGLGAGFKGACIALVDSAYKEEIQEVLTEKYLEQFPEYEKSFQVFWVKPDDGARFA